MKGVILANVAERALHVGVLAYDGCLGSEIFGVSDVLLIANRIAQAQGSPGDLFRVTVMAGPGQDVVATASGVPVAAEPWHSGLDALVVPGFDLRSTRSLGDQLADRLPEAELIDAAAAAGVAIGSICVGAFLLGEAGVLDDRRATTAWLFADALQARYPRAVVDAEAMVVTDGTVTTTAAFSAVHDLALRLVRAHAGDDLARSTARVTLIADNRSSQAPYVDDALADPSAAPFARAVKRWLVERLDRPYDLAALAEAFDVSTRTLLRKFGSEAGQTPLGYLQRARINAAKRLLELPGRRVADAMYEVGYTDPTSFRRLFAEHVGMTPAAYRSRFTAPAGSSVGARR